MDIERIGVDAIRIAPGRRPVDPERVATLAESIRKIGLQTPVTVWMDDNDVPHLVAGAHRVAACKLLDIDVDAFVTTANEIDRELWEIAENLYRVDLTKEQRDQQIRRYAELLKEREAISRQNVAKIEPSRERGRPEGIAKQIAEETGLSQRTVQRVLAPSDPNKALDRERMKREAAEREREAREARERAEIAVCDLLLDKLSAKDWDRLIGLMDAAGWSRPAAKLRAWQSPSVAA